MKMSQKEQINRNLNQFTQLVKEHATATRLKLEFSCFDGKVTVSCTSARKWTYFEETFFSITDYET